MNSHVLALRDPEKIVNEFKKIGVDWGGIKIMKAKGALRLIKAHAIASFSANILKQEMLSLGGDVALSRDAVTGKARKTDCLLMGNLAQINRLVEKLQKQPFGLAAIAQEIKGAVDHYQQRTKIWKVASRRIRLGHRTFLMGILNATPDSFSGDGVLGMRLEEVLEEVKAMAEGGADILDIGGESTRPGSRRVSCKEERRRVMTLLRPVRRAVRLPISIDTMKSQVAEAALDEGADIVNDVSALTFDKRMAKVVARHKAALVLMHMKGRPRTMQKGPAYTDVMAEIIAFLKAAIRRAVDAGIDEERIILDPGIGFGKMLSHNLEVLQRLSELKSLGRPILVGFSRKRFIGEILGADVRGRTWGTAAVLSMAVAGGADVMRVHDVRQMRQVALVADALARR